MMVEMMVAEMVAMMAVRRAPYWAVHLAVTKENSMAEKWDNQWGCWRVVKLVHAWDGE